MYEKICMQKIQEFSFENIDKFSSSSLVTRLTTDVTNVQNAYMMIVRIAVRGPLMFLLRLSWHLSWVERWRVSFFW